MQHHFVLRPGGVGTGSWNFTSKMVNLPRIKTPNVEDRNNFDSGSDQGADNRTMEVTNTAATNVPAPEDKTPKQLPGCELYKALFVEVVKLTAKAARPNNIKKVLSFDDIEFQSEMQPLTPKLPAEVLPAKPTSVTMVHKDSERMTDAPAPYRERSTQTEERTTVSVVTQCQLDESELEFQEAVKVGEEEETLPIDEKAAFAKFFEEKTMPYPNGKVECLLCGEIALNVQRMRPHVFFYHWGMPVLCHVCGQLCENKLHFENHACQVQEKKKPRCGLRRALYCPYARCKAKAISRLELYDHINEHTSEKRYKCKGCQRSFCTMGELRHHLPSHYKCFKAINRPRIPYELPMTKEDTMYRVRVFLAGSTKKKFVLMKKSLEFKTRPRRLTDPGRCSVCLQFCSNQFTLAKHNERCLKSYNDRLKRKRKMLARFVKTS